MFRGQAEVVQRLIDLRADVDHRNGYPLLSPFGMMVTMHALRYRLGHVTPLTHLCFHIPDSTPLMAAIMSGHYDGAAILIAAGARIDIRNSRGLCAADFALEQKTPEFLLQAFWGQKEECATVASLALFDGFMGETV